MPSLLLATGAATAAAQDSSYTLEACRSLALSNNKQLLISEQQVNAAKYQKREAFAAYLPAIDFAGGYMYNQKTLSVFDSDQLLPTKTFNLQKGEYEYNLVTNPLTGQPLQTADGQYVPETVALIPKDALEFDIHNVFFGAVTLTQPVYMGGKIVALNKIANYAEELAGAAKTGATENVIYAVDAAYWQVISLCAKQKLAHSYVALLEDLSENVSRMVAQGVATHSDQLSVDVKLNSAQVDLTKVDNGVTLSRMALAQLCGLPINSPMTLADENADIAVDASTEAIPVANMSDVYERRSDLQQLRIGANIMAQKKKVALSSMLPNVAVVGTYSFSNPNMYNGFSKDFNGMFSVGAMVTIPLVHWGGNYAKYKAAETDENIMKLRLDDAEELVNLQVNQATFKAQEAVKTFDATRTNLTKADENLRQAQLSFKEGVATTDNVMEAQTAWLKANSENIDAMIDVQLCRTYLSKVLGTLTY
jgi:outer membrane protein TolC